MDVHRLGVKGDGVSDDTAAMRTVLKVGTPATTAAIQAAREGLRQAIERANERGRTFGCKRAADLAQMHSEQDERDQL